MHIYTRKGDSGTTRLFTGEQIGKADLRVETYGTMDELQAQLGVCRAVTHDPQMAQILIGIEETLVSLAAEIASTPDRNSSSRRRVEESDIQALEAIIDRYSARYGLPKGFVIPGHSHDSAALHLARTVCRRCERLLVALFQREPGRSQVLAYINRLSDLLFILAWGLEASDDDLPQTTTSALPRGNTPSLFHELASLLAQSAIRHSRSLSVPMVIALGDSEGELLHFTRMEGALPASRNIAINKAYTAAALRMPTHELGVLCQPGRELYGVQHSLGGRAVLFGGGYPLTLDGRILGAIGISGGTVAQDMEVGEQVLQLWDNMTQIARSLIQALPPEAITTLCAHPQVVTQACGQWTTTEPTDKEMLAAAIRLLPQLAANAK